MHGRPDGSLPPSPRWSVDDEYRLPRLHAAVSVTRRHVLNQERQAVVDRLDELDREAGDLVHRRRLVLEQAREVHRSLWPAATRDWARRPPRPDQAPLAPMVNDAEDLSGWALRWVITALLRRHGELELRELHDLIHLMGYRVGGRQPVKALADAAGHERDHGRAERVRRGVYRIAPDDGDHTSGPVWELPDPELAMMPAWWAGTWAQRYELTDGSASRGLGDLRPTGGDPGHHRP